MTHHEGSPTPFARVMRWVRADRNDVLLVVLYAVISAVVALSIPITVQAMVNTVAFGALLQPMIVLALLVFAGRAAAALFRALQVRVVETIQERVFARTALQLSHRLPHLDSSVFDEAHGPELVNRFFDVVTVQKAASVLLVDGSALALQTLVGMIVLAFYHPYLLAFDALLLGGIVLVFFGLVPLAWFLSLKLDFGLVGMWLAAALYAILASATMSLKFRSGSWKSIRI